MKKLLLLLLLPLYLFGQTGVKRHANHYSGDGDPSGNSISVFPSLSLNCTYTNRGTGKVFRYTNTGTTKWIADSLAYPKGQKGDKGDKGDPGAKGATGLTGPQGIQGQSGPAGVQGPIGPQGIPGKDGVCPPCPPSGGGGSFPFTVVVAAAGDDRALIQAAINKNASDNIPVYLIGNFDISGEITVAKTNYRLTLFMYGAKITASNQNPFTFFKRTMPVDNSDANIYISATFIIYGGELVGYSSQSGFDLGPSYMSRYQDVSGQYLKEFITLRFALNTTVENCKATECVTPFIASIGNWTGADNSNSQSNHTSFNHCKAYMPQNGNIAFYIFAASGCSVTNSIIEGFGVTNGIFFDSNSSNVVRDATVENVHFECVNGATGAFIKMNYSAGTLTINKIYGQYPALLLDVKAGEFTTVEVSNVPWFRVKNGKLIKRTGDVQIFLERIIVEGPTHINGSNVMSFVDNSGTTYRTPYYFEDPVHYYINC